MRRASVRLAPPKQKTKIEYKGKGEPIRILMLGDSSIAGVGVTEFDDCLSGQTPKLLYKKSGRSIEQRTCGNNSATAGQLLEHVVPHLEHTHYDFVVLNIGVNDTKNFHTGRRFKKEFGNLLYALNAKFPEAKIIWQNIIDMKHVPVLPTPLDKVLSIRSRILKQIGINLCRERIAIVPDIEWNPKDENWSEDGFHVSVQGYKEWADKLSDFILKLHIQQEK